uniref:Ubiquitin-like protease family profile domain-containing protein n=1 Tax=Romanomermis culicivorax TaxID=13658 RepID=A0A915J4L7_ROMCU
MQKKLCSKRLSFELINVTSSTQANSYDCGVYLLIFAEKISSKFNEHMDLCDISGIKTITTEDADQYRKDILKIIESFVFYEISKNIFVKR